MYMYFDVVYFSHFSTLYLSYNALLLFRFFKPKIKQALLQYYVFFFQQTTVFKYLK